MAEEGIRVQGEEPSEEELQWLDYGRKLLEESPKILDEDAKSFVALGSSLLTIYTGALALFKFNERLDVSMINLALMSLPIILWLLSISFNAYVYFPGRYEFARDSPTDLMRIPELISRIKYSRLKIGAILFILALGSSSFSILSLGSQMSSHGLQNQPQNVQFIIAEDKVPAFRNMSILIEEGTLRTVPLLLLESTEKTYSVLLQDGRKAAFDKEMVVGIVYLHMNRDDALHRGGGELW